MKLPLCIALFFAIHAVSNFAPAQNTYTEIQYDYRVDSSVYYGTAINYAGNPVELTMDIYKPVGDNNPNRPVLVLAFGGAWIAGDKRNSDITSIAPWFARRGFVVAAPDYRLGFHPSVGSGSNYLTCPAVTMESNCVYPADSNEVIRAMFRAMQDIKGAIRFMKSRFLEDSLCIENCFVAGVSAGGFNALAAAFLDDESEKPAAAFALEDAPGPPGALNYCHAYYNQNGSAISRNRPDLGSIHGEIALNGFDEEVSGVFNLIGGMMGNYFQIENGASPLLYMHHQTSDLIVSCNQAPLLSDLSYTCLSPFGFLGCNHVWNMPRARGSCAIENLLSSGQYNITYQSDIAQTGGPNCLQDPPGHSVLAPQTRVAEITAFISEKISQNEQQGCNLSTWNKWAAAPKTLLVYPNPAKGKFRVLNPQHQKINSLRLFNAAGLPVGVFLSPSADEFELDGLPAGMYFLEIETNENRYMMRFLHTPSF